MNKTEQEKWGRKQVGMIKPNKKVLKVLKALDPLIQSGSVMTRIMALLSYISYQSNAEITTMSNDEIFHKINSSKCSVTSVIAQMEELGVISTKMVSVKIYHNNNKKANRREITLLMKLSPYIN